MGNDQIGAASFDLLLGMSKFDKDLDKAEQKGAEAGKEIGENLTSEAESAIERGGSGITTAVAGIAAAAVAAFGVGLAAAMDRQAQSGLLGEQLGLSPSEAARAGKVAGQVYADNFGEGLGDVNEALRAIHTNMGGLGSFSDATLKQMAEGGMTLARVMGEDVNRVIRGAGQLLRNGLAPDAQTAFDMILAGSRRIPAEMQGELLDSIEEYAADWRQAGLSGTQAIGMITGAVQAGARNTDLASDAIREFTIQVTDGGEDARAVLAGMGIDADAMAAAVSAGGASAAGALSNVIKHLRALPPSKQEMAGVALFGTMFENLGMDAVAAMDPATAAMGQFEGATQRAAETLSNNASANLEQFKRKVENAWVNLIGGKVLPLINQLPPAVQGVTYGFMALGGGVGSLVQSFGPLLLLLGKGGGMGGGTGLLGSLGALGPYALAAIAALAAAYVIIHNWDTIRQWFASFWGWLRDTAASVVDWFKRNWTTLLAIITGPIGLAVLAITRNWDTITGGASDVVSKVKSTYEGMVGWVRSLPSKIASAASGMWDGIWQTFRATINSIIKAWNGLRFPALTIPKNVATDFLGVGGSTIGGWAVPQIPLLALGGNITRRGDVIVGDNGPERLTLPRGARVTPLDHPSLASAATVEVSHTTVLEVSGREIARVTRPYFIDTARRSGRDPFRN